MAAKTKHLAGFPGGAYEAFGEELDFTNASPMTAQVTTITLGGTLASGDVIEITIGGETVSIELTGASKATAADALADALNANVTSYTIAEAVSDGTSKVTLTSRVPTDAFDVASSITSSAGTTTDATTAGTEADAIPFGRYILRDEVASTVTPYPNRRGRLPSAAGDVDDDKALCVALRKYDEPGDSYSPRSRCAGMKRGSVVVRLGSSAEPADGDAVYIGYGTGIEGVFFADSASNTKALDPSVARFRKYLGDGLAVVDCNFH